MVLVDVCYTLHIRLFVCGALVYLVLLQTAVHVLAGLCAQSRAGRSGRLQSLDFGGIPPRAVRSSRRARGAGRSWAGRVGPPRSPWCRVGSEGLCYVFMLLLCLLLYLCVSWFVLITLFAESGRKGVSSGGASPGPPARRVPRRAAPCRGVITLVKITMMMMMMTATGYSDADATRCDAE